MDDFKLPGILYKGIGFGIGGFLGVLGSLYNIHAAKAAVKVRPELANVGFVDAVLTNHGHDWLFYHYPNIGSLAVISLLTPICGLMWLVILE